MTETETLVSYINEALHFSLNRVIVLTESVGATGLRNVPTHRYRILIPENINTYEFTTQIAKLLKYRVVQAKGRAAEFSTTDKVADVIKRLKEECKIETPLHVNTITSGFNRGEGVK